MSMTTTATLSPGGRLGRYELLEELGRGGMGLVFKARDPAIERLVAVKTLRLDVVGEDMAEAVTRFQREAQAIGQLAHPHIVTLFDAQQEGELAYLVMEYVAGQSLDVLLRAGTVLPVDRVCAIGIEVCDALAHAHSRDVIHRDIKPANILLQENGQAKVTDFGVAYLAKSTLTKPGQSLGTPSYMSPEQIEGKSVDGRSDLFSLGAVLYELCCNQKAFPGETVTTVIYQILHTEPAPLHQVNALFPPILDATIRRALAKDPADRYTNAREFWEALAQVTAVMASPAARAMTPTSVAPPPSTTVPAHASRRRRIMVGMGAACLMAVLGGLLWEYQTTPPSTPSTADPGNTSATAPPPKISPPPSVAQPPAAQTVPTPSAPPGTPLSPKAVRVTFARDIKGVLPTEEDDTFYQDDRKVILWVRWANVRGKHTTLTKWYNPDGDLAYASPKPDLFDSPAEWWTTWATLPLPRGMSITPGLWRAEIQFDDQILVIAQFLLFDRPRPPFPIHPPPRTS